MYYFGKQKIMTEENVGNTEKYNTEKWVLTLTGSKTVEKSVNKNKTESESKFGLLIMNREGMRKD